MKHFTALAVAAIVVLAAYAPAAMAQPGEIPSNYEHLKSLEPLVGEWVSEGQQGPGGQQWKMQVSGSWLMNKNYVQLDFRGQGSDSDREMHIGRQIIGWNAASGSIESWSFNGWGGRSHLVWSVDGDKITGKGTRVGRDGEERSSGMMMSWKDETLSLQWLDEDGQSRGPGMTLRREAKTDE